MTPTDLALLAGEGSVVDESFGITTVDVPAARWRETGLAVRDDPRCAGSFFDWLSAYDDLDAGLAVVAHVWSQRYRKSVVLRTHVAREEPRLPSLTAVWPGADWHERETFEMFGIDFDGHPNLVPLLLPDGFEGNPLRKEFVLTSRVAKAWPGEKEPLAKEPDARTPEPGAPDAGTAASEK